MSHQGNVWEREYRNPKLVTKDDKPQADVLRFLKFLKKVEKYQVEDKNILDLGCGTGRNSNYLAKEGGNVIGIDISKTALMIAKDRARENSLMVDYRLGDIGEKYEIKDNTIDLVLDVTASNSLDEKGRENYLRENLELEFFKTFLASSLVMIP
ncbi:MAG: class I SAM-dependent methyltransferase [Erysipelotrichia bacterium]|nr:class I SAM-dependent methyltransferase [Erysipelotrichia bacterium]